MSPTFDVVASGFGLLEGPTIDEVGCLWFSDVTNGGVYRMPFDTGVPELVIPRRRYVGGTCSHRLGGIVITGRDVTRVRSDGTSTILFRSEDLPPEDGSRFLLFSDLCADSNGRVFVGVPRSSGAGDPTSGQLIMVTAPNCGDVVGDDVILPNGVAVSHDGGVIFQADSRRDCIIRYSLRDGTPLRDGFLQVDHGDFPDGLATDLDGGIWVACYGSGRVVRLDEEGQVDVVLEVPASEVTNVCFGGDDYSDLFVVTADHDEGIGGCILKTTTEHVGTRPPPAWIDR